MPHPPMGKPKKHFTHSFLVEWRAKNSFAAFVQLGHDNILSLSGCGLGRKVYDVGFVDILIQFVQKELLK